MTGHVEVSFSCPACGLTNIRVKVPDRAHRQDLDLQGWLDDVAAVCQRLHLALRKGCQGAIDLRVPESEKRHG